MRASVIVTLFLLLAAAALAADLAAFDRYFVDATLRIDYLHAGNAAEEIVTLDRVLPPGDLGRQPRPPARRLRIGRYLAKLHDAATGALIFSRGFDSYFGEYRDHRRRRRGRAAHLPRDRSWCRSRRRKVRLVARARGSATARSSPVSSRDRPGRLDGACASRARAA